MSAKDIEAGAKAPKFCLSDQEGREVCSGDLQGKWTVIYFYPKDDTPGCTIEAKDFSCAVEDLSKLGTRVVGISPDDGKSHLKFIGKHDLKVTLLSDPEHIALEQFGAWKKKSMYGKEFMGVDRSTFMIDENGIIRRVWRKVKVEGHVDEVLKTVKQLKQSM